MVLGALSSFSKSLLRKGELVALLLLCCGCLCYVSLPHGAVGWSIFFVFLLLVTL